MTDSNLHTHGKYSDGVGELEEFVKSAISFNMSSLGFSTHSPVPFINDWSMKKSNISMYINDVLSLKKKYQNKLPIYLGMELDYIENIDVKEYIDFTKLPLDYYIGAVHYIYLSKEDSYKCVDDSFVVFEDILINEFKNDMKVMYTKYFETYREMIKKYKPPILAHLDLIKKNNKDNKYFSEDEINYVKQIHETLKVIKQSECVLEINTGGMARGYTSEPYPSLWILKECNKLGIKITINADAHKPEMVNYNFKLAYDYAKKAGYEYFHQFNGQNFTKKLLPVR